MGTEQTPPAGGVMAALATVSASPALLPGSPEFESTVTWMAAEYQAGMAELTAGLDAVQAAGERIAAAFPDAIRYRSFRPQWEYGSGCRSYGDRPEDRAKLADALKRDAWAVLVDRLGLRNVMSVRERADFDKQMESGDLPDITPDAMVGVIVGMLGQAGKYMEAAAREVFDYLRPQHRGTGGQYKTNDPFRVGRRAVLWHAVEPPFGPGGPWRQNYHREPQLIALDNVFHLLDGRSILRDGRPPLLQAIGRAGADGRGETDLFRFRCFKNGNLHLTFLKPDLVKQLNLIAAGEAVLGPDRSDEDR